MKARRLSWLALFAAACEHGEPRTVEAESVTRPAWFRDEARSRGLTFDHVSGFDGGYRMPEIMTGGAALFDLDGDGDLDAYLVQAGSATDPARRPPNRLFVNDGRGYFRDATEGSGAGDTGYGNGVACGDYDGDGRTDLYVTNLGANVLLKNRGDGTFEDRTAVARVGDRGWGTSACFADLDGDGDLDLFVCNYLEYSTERERTCLNHLLGGKDYCSPIEYAAPAADVLYRNDGDGTFTDVSAAAGIASIKGNGLGVVCCDLDGDGRTDVFVANDGMADRLWRNLGDLTFVEEALERCCALDNDGRAAAGMGVAAADVDWDGDVDLFVCNLRGESDSLFDNRGNLFANVTASSGLGATSRPLTRFGVGLCDFDNDGLIDVYQANGRVVRHANPFSTSDVYAEPNLLFRGTGPARWSAVEPRGGVAEPLIGTSRAAAFGDVDGDGGIDVLVINKDGPANLLMNVVPGRGHWIAFRVLDERGSDALGAVVTIATEAGRRSAAACAGYGYQSSSDPRVHFGLDRHKRVETVDVRWPNGATRTFGATEADRVVTLAFEDG